MTRDTPRTQAVSPVVRDPSRLAALRRLALLDTPAEESFDRLTRLAARVLGAPVALVSLVDEDRQFFKSCVGLPEPAATERGTPLSHSFCQHVVSGREPLLVEDARTHPLVMDNLAVSELGVAAYLGMPLITSDGYELGTLCVIDTSPRSWSPADVEVLRDLAASVLTEIELRAAMREMEEARRQAEGEEPRAERARAAEEKRLRQIASLARSADEKLAAGTATLVDLVFRPRDVLWLAERAAGSRPA